MAETWAAYLYRVLPVRHQHRDCDDVGDAVDDVDYVVDIVL